MKIAWLKEQSVGVRRRRQEGRARTEKREIGEVTSPRCESQRSRLPARHRLLGVLSGIFEASDDMGSILANNVKSPGGWSATERVVVYKRRSAYVCSKEQPSNCNVPFLDGSDMECRGWVENMAAQVRLTALSHVESASPTLLFSQLSSRISAALRWDMIQQTSIHNAPHAAQRSIKVQRISISNRPMQRTLAAHISTSKMAKLLRKLLFVGQVFTRGSVAGEFGSESSWSRMQDSEKRVALSRRPSWNAGRLYRPTKLAPNSTDLLVDAGVLAMPLRSREASRFSRHLLR
ncbi:hypothetical protein EJ04DRAFT_603394 [Polyplosphaeria fusca]|uniref:Uncharacterized protein n=1 Tax=Polyplosphaeria fusca TaxID=682080 RepID=A0A9P4R0H5_9PLEO|nr:hypothetical protein EJ04DRAFT_603394 [Polyplosphaeria fusca]